MTQCTMSLFRFVSSLSLLSAIVSFMIIIMLYVVLLLHWLHFSIINCTVRVSVRRLLCRERAAYIEKSVAKARAQSTVSVCACVFGKPMSRQMLAKREYGIQRA